MITAGVSPVADAANATATTRGNAMQAFLQQAMQELQAQGQNPTMAWTRPPGSDNGAFVLPPEATMSMGGKTLGTELSDAFVQRENGMLQGTPGEILSRMFAGTQWAGQTPSGQPASSAGGVPLAAQPRAPMDRQSLGSLIAGPSQSLQLTRSPTWQEQVPQAPVGQQPSAPMSFGQGSSLGQLLMGMRARGMR